MAFCCHLHFKTSQRSQFFKMTHSLIVLMGHTIEMNAHVIYKRCSSAKTWQIPFLKRAASRVTKPTQPPSSPEWCLPSTNAQFSGATRTAAEEGGRRGETQECPANSCCVTLSIGCQNQGLFFKVAQKALNADRFFSTMRSRAANAAC